MKIKNANWVVIGFLIISFFIYKVGRRFATNYLLKINSLRIKAVIIGERNYMGNQPVKPKFSYSYQFNVNGKKFTGNAHDTTVEVGDTIEVEYYQKMPSINKPLRIRE